MAAGVELDEVGACVGALSFEPEEAMEELLDVLAESCFEAVIVEVAPAVVVSPVRPVCVAPVATTPAINAVNPVAAAAAMLVRRLTRLRFLSRFWMRRACVFTESPVFLRG